MIETWFENKGSYADGLALLYQVCGSNKRMYNRLAKSGESRSNIAALKYELNKYRGKQITTPKPQNRTKPTPANKSVKASTLVNDSVQQSNAHITLAAINDPHLQGRYIEKNQAFYKRWMLKKQLNHLPEESEDKALELIVEIMKLTKLIDTIWTELDYFMVHKVRMPKANDYSGKTMDELMKIRQRLYQKRTKRKKTLEKWKTQLSNIEPRKKITLQSKIDERQNTLTQINLDIDTLTQMIDG